MLKLIVDHCPRQAAPPHRDLSSQRRLLRKGVRALKFEECDRLKRLKVFVDQHFSEAIDLDVAAGVALMERSSFSRFFSTTVGISFVSWLTRVRLDRALRLFESEEDIKITDIAFSVGFTSLRNFQRSFKKYLGSTPKQLKDSLRGSPSRTQSETFTETRAKMRMYSR